MKIDGKRKSPMGRCGGLPQLKTRPVFMFRGALHIHPSFLLDGLRGPVPLLPHSAAPGAERGETIFIVSLRS